MSETASVTLPWDQPEPGIARDIAGALANFWSGGDGPSNASLSTAFALAGVAEPNVSNK